VAYTDQDHPVRRELLYSGNGPQTVIPYTFVVDEKATRATSATIAIEDSSGTALLAATAMTLEASPSATFNYTVDCSDTDDYTLAEGYKATIAVTYGGAVYTDVLWFDVCRRPLVPTLTDSGLEELEQELAHYKDTGETDWSKKIRAAWGRILSRLRQKANQDGFIRPALIVGYDQLYEAHRLWTLELIWADRLNEGEAQAYKYEMYRDERRQELDAALASLTYSVGDAEDPDVTERENFSGIMLTR
jgi:hypothetical protein